jgi:hypothetical protein
MTKPRRSTDEDIAKVHATSGEAMDRIYTKLETGHWPPIEVPCQCGDPECTEKVWVEVD